MTKKKYSQDAREKLNKIQKYYYYYYYYYRLFEKRLRQGKSSRLSYGATTKHAESPLISRTSRRGSISSRRNSNRGRFRNFSGTLVEPVEVKVVLVSYL